jgi:hypothetical protein
MLSLGWKKNLLLKASCQEERVCDWMLFQRVKFGNSLGGQLAEH